uniref:Uncharacterized protein n=1 Tax=Anguilla anguilla TaxID=7936 RepID=A0A0E9PYW7_ANGAN
MYSNVKVFCMGCVSVSDVLGYSMPQASPVPNLYETTGIPSMGPAALQWLPQCRKTELTKGNQTCKR